MEPTAVIDHPRLSWKRSFGGGEFATVPGTRYQVRRGILGVFITYEYGTFVAFAETVDAAVAHVATLPEVHVR